MQAAEQRFTVKILGADLTLLFTHRLFMSTSAFLQQMLEKRRPIPRMAVRANMIFCLPSTLVFSTRRMC